MRYSPQGFAMKVQNQNVTTIGPGTANQQGRNIFVHPGEVRCGKKYKHAFDWVAIKDGWNLFTTARKGTAPRFVT
jgi:hypothetical protein